MSLTHTANESPSRRGKSLFSSARLPLIVLLLLLAWQAREVLLLLFAGVLLALLLSRLTEAVENHTPLPRGPAYTAVLLLLTGVIVGAGWLAAPSVSQQVDELTERLPQAIDRLSGIQAAESYLITPLVQRRLASLPPVLVIVSQILGGVLFGFLGFALATPLLAIVLVLVKRLYIEDRLGDSFEKPIEA